MSDTLDEAIANAKAIHNSGRLRWSTVPRDQRMCIGFTTNPEATGLTVHLLNEGAVYSTTCEPCDVLKGIYWVYVTQYRRCVLYEWEQKAYGLRQTLFGYVLSHSGTSGPGQATVNYLEQRKQSMLTLLDTNASPAMIKKAVTGTDLQNAAGVIKLFFWLKHLYSHKQQCHKHIKALWEALYAKIWHGSESPLPEAGSSTVPKKPFPHLLKVFGISSAVGCTKSDIAHLGGEHPAQTSPICAGVFLRAKNSNRVLS